MCNQVFLLARPSGAAGGADSEFAAMSTVIQQHAAVKLFEACWNIDHSPLERLEESRGFHGSFRENRAGRRFRSECGSIRRRIDIYVALSR